jgi:hypothetical protein
LRERCKNCEKRPEIGPTTKESELVKAVTRARSFAGTAEALVYCAKELGLLKGGEAKLPEEGIYHKAKKLGNVRAGKLAFFSRDD